MSWQELLLLTLGGNFVYGFVKGATLHFWKKRSR
jgi:hypothetical protein